MKRAIAIACTAAVMLAGCGKAKIPDLEKDYKEYWDYTFDGNYTIKKNAQECNDEQNVWDITFTDKDGNERSGKLTQSLFDDADGVKSESDWTVLNFVMSHQNEIIADEIYDQIISKNFECTQSDDNVYLIMGDGFEIDIAIDNLDLFEPQADILKADLDPESGVKYTACELKSWASDQSNSVTIDIYVNDPSKQTEFQEKMLDMGEAYAEYVGMPENYCFSLYIYDENSETGSKMELTAAGCKVLGVDTDPLDYNPYYILGKLGRMPDTDATDGEDGI